MKSLSTFLSIILTPLMAVLPIQAEMAPASVPGTSTPSSQNTTLLIRLANAGNAMVEASSSLRGYAIQVTDAAGLPVADAAVAIRLPEDGATGFFADGAHSAVAYTNSAGIAVFAQVNWGSTLGVSDIRVTAVKGDMHAGALIEQTIVPHSSVIPDVRAELKSLNPAPVPTPVAQTAPAQTPPAQTSAVTTGASPQPGTPASVRTGAAGPASVQTAQTAASPDPVVSVVNSGGSHSGSNKKWILLAVVAAGAGIGAALALSSKGGSSAAASSGVSIGTPSLSVGH